MIMILELSSLSVLQNQGKGRSDLESIGLIWKDIQNNLGNCFNKRGIGVIEASKVYYLSKVEGFCVTNAMKVLHINLVKIRVFSTKLFIWKKFMNFVR